MNEQQKNAQQERVLTPEELKKIFQETSDDLQKCLTQTNEQKTFISEGELNKLLKDGLVDAGQGAGRPCRHCGNGIEGRCSCDDTADTYKNFLMMVGKYEEPVKPERDPNKPLFTKEQANRPKRFQGKASVASSSTSEISSEVTTTEMTVPQQESEVMKVTPEAAITESLIPKVDLKSKIMKEKDIARRHLSLSSNKSEPPKVESKEEVQEQKQMEEEKKSTVKTQPFRPKLKPINKLGDDEDPISRIVEAKIGEPGFPTKTEVNEWKIKHKKVYYLYLDDDEVYFYRRLLTYEDIEIKKNLSSIQDPAEQIKKYNELVMRRCILSPSLNDPLALQELPAGTSETLNHVILCASNYINLETSLTLVRKI